MLLHGRPRLSCSWCTQVFPTWQEPCSIIHGEGWYKASQPAWTFCILLEIYAWCLRPESNQRDADFQSAALPAELPRHLDKKRFIKNKTLFFFANITIHMFTMFYSLVRVLFKIFMFRGWNYHFTNRTMKISHVH